MFFLVETASKSRFQCSAVVRVCSDTSAWLDFSLSRLYGFSRRCCCSCIAFVFQGSGCVGTTKSECSPFSFVCSLTHHIIFDESLFFEQFRCSCLKLSALPRNVPPPPSSVLLNFCCRRSRTAMAVRTHFLLKQFGSSAALLKSNEGHDGRVSAFLFMALAPFVCLH